MVHSTVKLDSKTMNYRNRVKYQNLKIIKEHIPHTDSYTLGSSYCTCLLKSGDICIFVDQNLRFSNVLNFLQIKP
jgi:hypothetical protein